MVDFTDFMSELIGCMTQRPRYERELEEDTVNGYHIDTCAVDDRDWLWETAICHKRFNSGDWIVVQGYDTEEKAKAGHNMWIEKAKAGFQKLYDVYDEKAYFNEEEIANDPHMDT